MRLKKTWIAALLLVVAGVGLSFALAPSRARLLIRNEGVAAIRGDVRMDHTTWAFFVPVHEVRDLSLPPGPATVEITGDPNRVVRQVMLVGGETTTIDYTGER